MKDRYFLCVVISKISFGEDGVKSAELENRKEMVALK